MVIIVECVVLKVVMDVDSDLFISKVVWLVNGWVNVIDVVIVKVGDLMFDVMGT